MFCCVCAGSCNHIGPHSYCPAHGGVPTGRTWTSTGTNVVYFGPRAKRIGLLRRLFGRDRREERDASLKSAARRLDAEWDRTHGRPA